MATTGVTGRVPVVVLALVLATSLTACEPSPDDRNQQLGYRDGTIDDGYTSNGERGNVNITEVNWGGSMHRDDDGTLTYDPDDDFIEFRNKHPRPIHLTGWLVTIEIGDNMDTYYQRSRGERSEVTFVLPPRENGLAIEPNEFVVVASKRDGAFREADYYVEDLRLPEGSFDITLRDLDERLIDGAGDARKHVFAGAADGRSVRSMERIQLVFSNRGNRDNAWHTYSLNDFDEGRPAQWHQDLRREVHEEYRPVTFATPGQPNSPDYSGNVSSGSFE